MQELLRAFLAENNWSHRYMRLIHATPYVVPSSFCGMWRTMHLATLLGWWTVGFTSVPCRIACQRTTVCPVKLRVCLTVKSQPCSPYCSFWLLANKIVDELIFCRRGDFSEVPSQLLAISSSSAPLQFWNVDDKEARFAIRNPTVGTRRFCWKKELDKRKIRLKKKFTVLTATLKKERDEKMWKKN